MGHFDSKENHFEEDRLEKDLRHALRRKEPPNGFAARVASRVSQAGNRNVWAWSSILAHPRLRWAVVVMLGLLVWGGISYRRERQLQRARGEAAKQQVMLALRITGSKIKRVQSRIQGLSDR